MPTIREETAKVGPSTSSTGQPSSHDLKPRDAVEQFLVDRGQWLFTSESRPDSYNVVIPLKQQSDFSQASLRTATSYSIPTEPQQTVIWDLVGEGSAQYTPTIQSTTLPIPRLSAYRSNSPHLTLNIQEFLWPFWTIVISKALQAGFPIDKGRVDIEFDPDESVSRVVIRVYTRASATQTIAFWNSLARDIDHWFGGLSVKDKTTILEDISLRFHWLANV